MDTNQNKDHVEKHKQNNNNKVFNGKPRLFLSTCRCSRYLSRFVSLIKEVDLVVAVNSRLFYPYKYFPIFFVVCIFPPKELVSSLPIFAFQTWPTCEFLVNLHRAKKARLFAFKKVLALAFEDLKLKWYFCQWQPVFSNFFCKERSNGSGYILVQKKNSWNS